MNDEKFDITVIGGGIVGLATALATCQRRPGTKILVLEKEPQIASHQTGHNSGVIHSGIYYRPGSLKAKNCVVGAARMVEFCQHHGIPYEICGKVIVATNEEERTGLAELHRRGLANGVADIQLISPEQLKEIEPHCQGVAALHVPSTGITDFRKVAQKYAELVTLNGGTVRTGTEVTKIDIRPDEIRVRTNKGVFLTKFAINCAGLHSDRVMRMAGEKTDLQIVPFRGEYYELASKSTSLVRTLIYPVADPRFPFLGVHFTKKINGGVEAGPNAVLAFKREGYHKADFSARDTAEVIGFPGFWKMAGQHWKSALGEYHRSFSKPAFTRALQKLLPELRESDLIPGGSGVRAQALDKSGKLVDDFYFVESERMVHVCNVPSPAATASLVIGENIVERAAKAFKLRTA